MKKLLPLACLALLAASAAAQNAATPDIESQGQRPALEEQKQKQAVEASEQAAPQARGAKISYEQILQHPDDIELNYQFARQQVWEGDLKGASATLERVLTVNPDLAKVRLLFAVVLYRLNDLTESERELKRLRQTDVPHDVIVEIDKYLAAIADSRKKTHLSATVGVGVEFDTNRNAWPAHNQFLFEDAEITGLAHHSADTALVTLVGIGVKHDLTEHNQLFLDGNYYRADQSLIKSLDLQAYSLDSGDSVRTPWGYVVKPSFVFDHVLLGQQTFLRDYGADLRVEKNLSRHNLLFADVREVYDDYQPVVSVPIGDELSGNETDTRLGLQHVLTPTMRLDGSVGYDRKNAASEFWAYDRYLFNVTHTWLLPRGMFLLSSAEVHFDQYQAPDPFVSIRTRHDETGRFSFTYGVPLDLMTPALKNFIGTFNYEYYQALSNLSNYGYTNNKVAAMVTYKWGLGL